MQKIFVFDDIGKVVITKKSGLRSLRLHVHPAKGVTMSIPWHVGFNEALTFLDSKKSWVVNKLNNFETQQFKDFFVGDGYTFSNVMIQIDYRNTKKLSAKYTENKLLIVLPENTDYKSEQIQAFIKKACAMALKNKATGVLPDKVTIAAQKHGFRHGNIRIGNSRTRWGSCRSDNRITFSCFLMLLPEELIDFVIIHELCHTVHKNHGDSFHQLVNTLCSGREKELSKKLKEARHPLMQA